MLKLKLQFFGHLMQRVNSLEKTLSWGRLRAEGEGGDRTEMVGCHRQLNEHEFEQTPRDGDGQESLAYCSPWGHKEIVTEQQQIVPSPRTRF